METTCGAVALIGSKPHGAAVVEKVSLPVGQWHRFTESSFQLLEAGAIVYAKATLSVRRAPLVMLLTLF